MLRKLTLFRRLPTLRWRPRVDEQIVPRNQQVKHPALTEDFRCLEAELLPHFQELDNEALRNQNQIRLEQVVLIFGGMLASAVGAIQAALPSLTVPSIIEAVLAAGLTAVAWRARALKAQKSYFTVRLKAETLRSEYFLFLGKIGPYANEGDRLRNLIKRVAEIKKEG